jgi:hypothetical protein
MRVEGLWCWQIWGITSTLARVDRGNPEQNISEDIPCANREWNLAPLEYILEPLPTELSPFVFSISNLGF